VRAFTFQARAGMPELRMLSQRLIQHCLSRARDPAQGRALQVRGRGRFCRTCFDAALRGPASLDEIVARASREAMETGPGAMDALHVAAVVLAGCEEFVTAEKSEKAVHRTKSIRVTTIDRS